jgi:hypothetical protein
MTTLTFHERMEGFFSFAESDFNQAWLDGRRQGRRLAFELDIEAWDAERFLDDAAHTARARGRIECDELGGALEVVDGEFNLFLDATGPRDVRMRYRLMARDAEGRQMTLSGFKDISDAPGFDPWSDTTTLFVRLYPGHVTAADEAGAGPLAVGILRITLAGFLRMLGSLRARGGTPGQCAATLARFGTLFAGRLWGIYGGRAALAHLADFPDARDPSAPRWAGHPPGEWHEPEELPGYRRRIIGFDAGDGLPLTLHNIRRREGDGGVPVLLIHGTGVRANLFLNAPGRASVVSSLLDAGFDVWLENWRASIDLGARQYTLDDAALFDHPAAIREVLARTGTDRLRVLAHCQGSTSFVITALAGYAPQVERVVSSAVSLHPVVPRMSRAKLTFMVPVVAMGTPYLSAQWGARAPNPLAQGIAAWARLMRRECDDPVCALANYMYGAGPDVLWRHANLDPHTHHWTSREFGWAPTRFLRQMGASVRAGHLVPASGHPGLPDSYVADPARIDAPWTFVAGTRNRLFVAESQRRTHAWFDERQRGRHGLQVYDGYGHLDLLFGRDSAQKVHPHLVAALGDPAG